MTVCLDVAYLGPEANVTAALFRSWNDDAGRREIVTRVASAAEYLPQQF